MPAPRHAHPRPTWPGRRATAAVEFGLIAPLLIILLSAAMDLGNAFQQSVRLAAAVRSGALTAATSGTTSSAISAAVTGALAGWTNVTVTVDAQTCQCLDAATGQGTGATSAAICGTTCAGGMAKYYGIHATRPFTPVFPGSRWVTFNRITQVRADVVARVQ